MRSGNSSGSVLCLWLRHTTSLEFDLFSFAIDPYQILGPTSSRLANPGETLLMILLLHSYLFGSGYLER